MRKITFITLLFLVGLTSLQLWMSQDRTRQESEMAQEAAGQGEPQVGGDFTLIDQSGKETRPADFRGRVMLVFFGFTQCPDICPVSVNALSQAMERLGAQADKVAPVFISVDPEHDTPAVLKDYLAPFDKRMIGLTGAPERVKEAAAAYKAYYAQQEASPMVDHSGYIYMMDGAGKFVRLFPYNAGVEEIAGAVAEHLKRAP